VKTWDDLLKPIDPLGENEITIQMAMKRLGVSYDKTALKRLEELEATGAIVFVGKRRLPNGRTVNAWSLK